MPPITIPRIRHTTHSIMPEHTIVYYYCTGDMSSGLSTHVCLYLFQHRAVWLVLSLWPATVGKLVIMNATPTRAQYTAEERQRRLELSPYCMHAYIYSISDLTSRAVDTDTKGFHFAATVAVVIGAHRAKCPGTNTKK